MELTQQALDIIAARKDYYMNMLALKKKNTLLKTIQQAKGYIASLGNRVEDEVTPEIELLMKRDVAYIIYYTFQALTISGTIGSCKYYPIIITRPAEDYYTFLEDLNDYDKALIYYGRGSTSNQSFLLSVSQFTNTIEKYLDYSQLDQLSDSKRWILNVLLKIQNS